MGVYVSGSERKRADTARMTWFCASAASAAITQTTEILWTGACAREVHTDVRLFHSDSLVFAGGCVANDLPGAKYSPEWYPYKDNFVLAPKGYRQTEGLCTRCGNIYEPACKGTEGPMCFVDAHAGVIMEPSEVREPPSRFLSVLPGGVAVLAPVTPLLTSANRPILACRI